MLVILLYLASQVCLKLVHWIYKCMQGQGTFGKVARLVLTYITTKCYFVKLLLLHDIVQYFILTRLLEICTFHLITPTFGDKNIKNPTTSMVVIKH